MTLSWSSCCYNFFVFFFACSCFFFCPLFNGALWVSFYIPLGYLSAYFYTQFLKGNSTMSMVSLHIQVLDWSFRTLFSTIYQLFPTDSSQNVKSYIIFPWMIVIYSKTENVCSLGGRKESVLFFTQKCKGQEKEDFPQIQHVNKCESL